MQTTMKSLLVGGLLLAFLAPAAAWAQDSWDGPVPVRVRYFEGGVTVQRVHAGETGEALVNLPLDEGDRVWTDREGRAELILDDGSIVWMAADTTLDVVSLRDGRGSGESLLRLWNGSVIVARQGGLGTLRFDAPEASFQLDREALARIDVEQGRSWLSVLDGRAQIQAGGVVELVSAGQRSYAESGTAPAEPVVFNTAEQDGFDSWYLERIARHTQTVEHVRRERDYLPREVVHYAADLEAHGNWFYYDEFRSWAWRPTVVVSGWAPYRHGRWVYTYGGWSWVSRSPWGWATSHYGRWHHVPARGWVWFPGRVYSPGWVSWHVGGGYVGWSPLGFYDRPLVSVNLWFGGHSGYGYGYHGNHRGYAAPRGLAVAGRGYTRGPDDAWTFVRDGDLGRSDGARRAVVDRTAVRRSSGNASSVSLQGPLRPRDPRSLVVGTRTATPRFGGGSSGTDISPRSTTTPRVAVGRGGDDRARVLTPRPRGGSGSSGVAVPRSNGGPSPAVRPGGGAERPTVTPRTASPLPRTPTVRTPTPTPSPRGRVALPRPSTGRSGSPTPRPSSGVTAPPIRPRTGSGSGGPAVIPRTGTVRGLPTITPRSSSTTRRPTVTPRGSVRAPTVTPRGSVRSTSPRPGGVASPRPSISRRPSGSSRAAPRTSSPPPSRGKAVRKSSAKKKGGGS